MDKKQWIIVYGGVVSGLCFVGTFDDPDTAADYATAYKLDAWEVAELDQPGDIERE